MKKINRQILVELIVFLIFIGILLYLILFDRYKTYVNPSMLPFLWLCVIMILLWTINRSRLLFYQNYRQSYRHLYVLIVPIILMLIPLGTLNPTTLPNSIDDGATFIQSQSKQTKSTSSSEAPAATAPDSASENPVTADPSPSNTQTPSAQAPAEETPKSPASTAPSTDASSSANTSSAPALTTEQQRANAPFIQEGLNQATKSITISNEYFLAWIFELNENQAMYQDYMVTITGYVHWDENRMKSDEFAVARLLMSCCSADLTPIGLNAWKNPAITLENGQWYVFKGKLSTAGFNGKQVPYLTLMTAIKTTKPNDEYIYP